MTDTKTSPNEYALGHSEDEQRRLDQQGAFLRPRTERWLLDAGIAPGMRVLDVGCGTGDVSRLAAEIVGPSGYVLGVDRAADVIAAATRSAAIRNLAQVRFLEADINTFDTNDAFDALIGRLVLMHLPDPVATVRHLAGFVRPGGIVAFADYFFLPSLSVPERKLFDRVHTAIVTTLRRVTPNADIGARLHLVFTDAGLPKPEVRYEITADVGISPEFEQMAVGVLRTLLPAAEKLGIMSAAEADIDTLYERIVAEAATTNGVAFGPVFSGAWTRLPG